MKINFKQEFLDLMSKNEDQTLFQATKECVVVDENNIPKRPKDNPKGYMITRIVLEDEKITLKDVSLNVLFSEREDEKIDGKEKAEKFALGMKIRSSKDGIVDLKVDEITKIKLLIEKSYSTMFVGQADKFLESPVTETEASK